MLAPMRSLHTKTTLTSNNIAQLAVTITERLDRSLVLVGLMGSGKSAIGRGIAKILGLNFTDSDQKIVSDAGISITEIFELAGEEKFREMEYRTIAQLNLSKPQIIATGGGAFCHAQTSNLLLTQAHVVWLKAPPETLLARIGNTKSRPLLNNNNPLATLARLNKERARHYKKAQIQIDTNGLSTRKAMLALLRTLDTHLARR
jgi:shikimate kinase